ncbi:MAG: lysophospholipid acyltransferase family protein [Brevinemataceae bacterium]
MFTTFFVHLPLVLFFLLIKQYKTAAFFVNQWGKVSLKLTGVPYTVKGLEHLDSSKRYILVANHGSMTDIFATAAVLTTPMSWVMKDSLLKIPGLNIIFKLALGVAIPRVNALKSQKIFENQIVKLKQQINPNIIVYPEGTRSLTGEIAPFKKGFVRIMRLYQMDILPVTLSGFHTLYPPKKIDFNFNTELQITIHPVQKFKELESLDDKEITQKIQHIIVSDYRA